MAYYFDVTTKAAWGGFIVLPVSTNILGFIASAFVGASIGAVLVNLFKKTIEEKPEIISNSDDDDIDISFEISRLATTPTKPSLPSVNSPPIKINRL